MNLELQTSSLFSSQILIQTIIMKVGYAFIGTPKGLQTKNGGAIKNADIRQFVDLNSSEITVLLNTELLMVKKIVNQQDVYYVIAQYEYAKEMESERTGTFFGSAIVLKNAIAPPEMILLVLNQLIANLRVYLTPDSRFRAEFDKIGLPVLRRLKGLETNLVKHTLDTSTINDDAVLIQLEGKDDFRERANFLKQALEATTLAPFATFYATDDAPIIDFVQKEKSMRLASLGASYESMTEQLQRKYAYLMEQFEKGKGNYDTLRAACEKLSQTAKQLQEQRSTLQSQYEASKQKIANNMSVLDTALKHRKTEVTTLEARQTSLQERLLQMKEQKVAIQQDIITFQKQQQQLENAIAQLESKQIDVRAYVDALQREQSTLMAKNEELRLLQSSEIEI